MKKLILASFLALFSIAAIAQQNLSLYHFNHVQQNLDANPAMHLDRRLNIGIPTISGIEVELMNNIVTPRMLFGSSVSDAPEIQISRLRDKWKKRNYLGTSVSNEWLSFGTQIGEQGYFFFNVKENAFQRLTLPEGLLEFPFTGNASFDDNGGNVDLSGLGFELNLHRSWTFGYQHQVSEQLRVGGAVKFLQGLANVHTKRSDVLWTTDRDDFGIALTGQVHVQSSLPDSAALANLSASDFIAPPNTGFGLDLGAEYQFNERLHLSASLVDLGYINWTSNTKSFVTDELDFAFEGFDFSETILEQDSTDLDQYQAQLDELEASFEERVETYRSPLFARVYLGGKYRVFGEERSKGYVTGLYNAQLFNGSLLSNYSVGYLQEFGRWFQGGLNLAYANRGMQLGLGFSMNAGPVQWHLALDNVLLANGTRIVDGDEVLVPFLPYDLKKAHFQTGFNLTFGKGERGTKRKKTRIKGAGGKREKDGGDRVGERERRKG